MLKFKYALTLLVIFSIGFFPFLNGLGCDAVIEMNTAFFKMNGRCENGQIAATFYNKRIDETYSITGRLAILGKRYFLFVENTKIIKTGDENVNIMRRYAYLRKMRTGKIMGDKYILAYTPFPLIGAIKITGKLSIL